MPSWPMNPAIRALFGFDSTRLVYFGTPTTLWRCTVVTLSSYLAELTDVLGRIDSQAFDDLVAAIQRVHAEDKVIYTCGNGGSASTASHMINDLVKAPADASGCRPLRAIGLSDCLP